METELNRQVGFLEVIETARKFYKQKLGWAGRLMCFSCIILKYKTIESLMLMDIFVNIYLGTFMLYITEQIKYRKSRFTKRCMHRVPLQFPPFGGALEAHYPIY